MNKELMRKLTMALQKDDVSALMVAPSSDMKFLLGKSLYLCERFQALVVKADGTCFYICNKLSEDEAQALLPDGKVYPWVDWEDFTLVVKKAFAENDLTGKKIAVNGAVRAFNIAKIEETVDAAFVNGKHYLEETRIIKTSEELENLRKASLVADKVYEGIVKFIHPGVTEADISHEIARLTGCFGGVLPSGGGALVASGTNAALPHYFGGNRVIEERDVIEMDYGCMVGGMWSDITRTVFVGEPTARQREVYNLVLAANLAGEQAAVNGAYIPDVDRAARKVIEDGGFGPYFTHRLGHGIGYDAHEAPYIHGVYKAHLAPGMAFSCEPGIYLCGEFGVRIEDVVIINEAGETEILNHFTKELIVIK